MVSYTGPDGSLSYTYDLTGQLTSVSGDRTESYSYDANGNRTMTGYVTGDGNQLESDGTYDYTYDDEGNLLTKVRVADGQRTEYTWDYRNRLTAVVVKDVNGTVLTEVEYTYDVDNRRIGQSVDGVQTWTVYDGPNPYADFDGIGQLTNRYLYGPMIDQLFACCAADGTVAWYLTDRLGSVRQLVASDGTVLDNIDYDSYGAITNETQPADGDRFKFTAGNPRPKRNRAGLTLLVQNGTASVATCKLVHLPPYPFPGGEGWLPWTTTHASDSRIATAWA